MKAPDLKFIQSEAMLIDLNLMRAPGPQMCPMLRTASKPASTSPQNATGTVLLQKFSLKNPRICNESAV